jgi:hypothetical protein
MAFAARYPICRAPEIVSAPERFCGMILSRTPPFLRGAHEQRGNRAYGFFSLRDRQRRHRSTTASPVSALKAGPAHRDTHTRVPLNTHMRVIQVRNFSPKIPSQTCSRPAVDGRRKGPAHARRGKTCRGVRGRPGVMTGRPALSVRPPSAAPPDIATPQRLKSVPAGKRGARVDVRAAICRRKERECVDGIFGHASFRGLSRDGASGHRATTGPSLMTLGMLAMCDHCLGCAGGPGLTWTWPGRGRAEWSCLSERPRCPGRQIEKRVASFEAPANSRRQGSHLVRCGLCQ